VNYGGLIGFVSLDTVQYHWILFVFTLGGVWGSIWCVLGVSFSDSPVLLIG